MSTFLGLSMQGMAAFGLILLACATLAVAEGTGTTGTGASDPQDEIRRGMPMRPDGKSRSQMFYERIAKGVEPDLKGSPDRLDLYMERFRSEALNDRRHFAFDVEAQWDRSRGVVELTGFVEYEEHVRSLGHYFEALGLKADTGPIELMPAASLGGEPFAVVASNTAFLYAEPKDPSESVTQAKRGDAVFLLREDENGFFYCHAWDGYVGYIRATDIERTDAEGLAQSMPFAGNDKVDPAIEAGSALMGTPYKWGGTTADGIDCSGLTRYAYTHIGVLLPRDADQQSLVGRLTATRHHRQAMRRGDLMFFMGSRGKISHTAIYLGDQKYLESGGPGVRIGSLDPKDPAYEPRRDTGFAFAKRVVQ